MCPEENNKQSVYSPDPPGVVLNPEHLVRIVIAPEHIDKETGEVKNAAFKKDEFKADGLSLSRAEFATVEELTTQAENLASSREENEFMGVLVGQVQAIREITDGAGARVFCVIDDGLEDYPSHALVKRSGNQGDGILRKARNKMMKIFGSELRSIQDVLERD